MSFVFGHPKIEDIIIIHVVSKILDEEDCKHIGMSNDEVLQRKEQYNFENSKEHN